MAKLVTLKRQSGEAVYPVTVTAAVMDSNGNPAEVVFAKKNDSVSSKSSDQGVEVELSGTLASPTVKVNVTSSGITSDNNSVAIASDVFKYAAKNEVFKGAKEATSTSVAEAGKIGLVPAPASGATTKYLRSDGTWSDVNNSVLWDGRRYQYMASELSSAYVKVMTIFVHSPYQNGVISFSVGGRGDTVRSNVSLALSSSANIDNTVITSFVYYGDEKRCVDFSVYDFGVTTVNNVRGRIFEIWYKKSNNYDIFAISNVYHTTPYVTITVDMLNQSSAPALTPLQCTLAAVSLKAKYDANGNEINKTYVKKADTIKTTYDTDKGVKVELSGTFDEPKIDVTTTFGDVAISNSSNAVSGETIAKKVPLLIGSDGTAIINGSDLNTTDYCESAGTYYLRSASAAKLLTNCPSNTAFSMSVYAPLGLSSLATAWAYRVRKIIDIEGREWIQDIYSDNDKVVHYKPWRRILRDNTTFTQATTSTANGTQVVNAGTGGAVPAPQTLADNDKFLKGNGTWSAIPTSSVGSGITLPATGNAVHEALTGTTYINTIGTDFIDNLFTAKG